MRKFFKCLPLFFFLVSVSPTLYSQSISADKNLVVLSAIKGTTSKVDTVRLSSLEDSTDIGTTKINGDQAGFFKIISDHPEKITTGEQAEILIVFEPTETFVGIARAELEIGNQNLTVHLTGLSTKGLEGENESPLAEIIDALGYKIDVGWTTLANHLHPARQGEELAPAMFKKATPGIVEMTPVARYSPDFPLNFGYYAHSETGPVQRQVGILAEAGEFPEHQTLFPSVALGGTTFDPEEKEFGFYAISPGHSLYSEDIWNILFHRENATHAMRIYPVHSQQGATIENTYLVTMEEAANGDYNDYVFLVKNVEPVFIQNEYASLFNGKDLSGWYTWFEGMGRNNDLNNNFTVQPEGVLHVLGKDLGYLITEKSFGNYQFELEFKWGEKKWPPRENMKRDSGICYNIPADEPDQIWPSSVECQIQEGDVGDFWLLGYSTIQVDGKQNPPKQHSQIVKKKDAEKPNGEWNKVEVISFNGKSVHVVNDIVVNYGENSSLIGGKILLQSELAELYYRNIKIREL